MKMINNSECYRDYGYSDSQLTWSNRYVWPVLRDVVQQRRFVDKKAFEIGCGNGALANQLHGLGFSVTGVDLSKSGIEQARNAFPKLCLEVGSAYGDLEGKYGIFPLVYSMEVIAHCYDPRWYLRTFFDLLSEDGVGIISTPYHGYLKNLALAVTGHWDRHLNPLWDGGHIIPPQNTRHNFTIHLSSRSIHYSVCLAEVMLNII